jgi:hypothetical protein
VLKKLGLAPPLHIVAYTSTPILIPAASPATDSAAAAGSGGRDGVGSDGAGGDSSSAKGAGGVGVGGDACSGVGGTSFKAKIRVGQAVARSASKSDFANWEGAGLERSDTDYWHVTVVAPLPEAVTHFDEPFGHAVMVPGEGLGASEGAAVAQVQTGMDLYDPLG